MIRTIKALGLSLVAMLALGALASSASAVEFHSELETTRLTAEQDGTQSFKAAGGTITCTDVRFEGTTTKKTTSEVTFLPKVTTAANGTGFGGCVFLGVKTTVEMRSCDFLFTSGAETGKGGVHVKCTTAGDFITFRVSLLGAECDVKVYAQSLPNSVHYTNLGATTKREITADVNATGITYDAVGGACPVPGLDQKNGIYEGKQLVKGETDDVAATQVGIWAE
jgi:hypothetical protein